MENKPENLADTFVDLLKRHGGKIILGYYMLGVANLSYQLGYQAGYQKDPGVSTLIKKLEKQELNKLYKLAAEIESREKDTLK